MLVPQSIYEDAVELACSVASKVHPGDPQDPETRMGPVVSEAQYNKIQGLINKGLEEGAQVVIGGPGKPEGLETGYYVKPTIFRDVSNDMTIAREEIFGPVLCMIPYGGYKQSGNGREWGEHGIDDFLEIKAVMSA